MSGIRKSLTLINVFLQRGFYDNFIGLNIGFLITTCYFFKNNISPVFSKLKISFKWYLKYYYHENVSHLRKNRFFLLRQSPNNRQVFGISKKFQNPISITKKLIFSNILVFFQIKSNNFCNYYKYMVFLIFPANLDYYPTKYTNYFSNNLDVTKLSKERSNNF